jgi:hypothetical protein
VISYSGSPPAGARPQSCGTESLHGGGASGRSRTPPPVPPPSPTCRTGFLYWVRLQGKRCMYRGGGAAPTAGSTACLIALCSMQHACSSAHRLNAPCSTYEAKRMGRSGVCAKARSRAGAAAAFANREESGKSDGDRQFVHIARARLFMGARRLPQLGGAPPRREGQAENAAQQKQRRMSERVCCARARREQGWWLCMWGKGGGRGVAPLLQTHRRHKAPPARHPGPQGAAGQADQTGGPVGPCASQAVQRNREEGGPSRACPRPRATVGRAEKRRSKRWPGQRG